MHLPARATTEEDQEGEEGWKRDGSVAEHGVTTAEIELYVLSKASKGLKEKI
jgi:hypothetical protein